MSLSQKTKDLAQAIGEDIKDLYTKVDAFIEFKQQVPSAVWVLQHNLNKFPSVTIVDSSGEEVIGRVTYDDIQKVTVEFSGAFSGTAYLN